LDTMTENKGALGWRNRFFSYHELRRKRRTGAVLLRDILVAAQRGAKKTHIMFGSNMNPIVLNRYLDFAVKHGLLTQRANYYFVTEKGAEFLKCFQKLEELMNTINNVEQELTKLLQ
jgi:predicted transcriptional regulator